MLWYAFKLKGEFTVFIKQLACRSDVNLSDSNIEYTLGNELSVESKPNDSYKELE